MPKRGFTLVEVLTVILIIGILTTITTYTYNASLGRSRDSQRITDLKSIQNTLEQFYLDNRTYPELELGATVRSPWVAKFQLETYPNGSWSCNSSTTKSFVAPKYISSIPEDPMKKLSFQEGCEMAGSPVGSGQYTYVPLADTDGSNSVHHEPVTAGYYLLARMERANNVAKNLSDVRSVTNNHSFTRYVLDFPTTLEQGSGGRPWPGLPFFYCTEAGGNPIRPQCDINYFLSNKDR